MCRALASQAAYLRAFNRRFKIATLPRDDETIHGPQYAKLSEQGMRAAERILTRNLRKEQFGRPDRPEPPRRWSLE